ncbi:glycosyltransferase [Picrophilus oshimae]|uniref:Glycosyltransferase n=1 Tax=Picrophilus torridus (strain ATCC 700027 / DSM 9790 / JCM 10055 / NBRC 100828 / KAW 2/3) TaxID=1122961 RepID=Q6L2B6_PICTO|nr:glycosyltransferase [Picrophilus oshimae]AAT42886.1 glycosyltransferase [Picrophilus oshimae DSM 9789]
MLYIYGTIFNNAGTVLNSLASIKNINYEKIFIVDNYSNDGTYEILEKNKEKYRLEIKRMKCKRGLGRQKAMEMAMVIARDDDYLMTMDFDTIYGDDFTEYVNEIIKEPRYNSIFSGFLCLKEINKNVPWRNLNSAEDWERMGHFASLGFDLYLSDFDIKNQFVSGLREKRYAKGLKFYYRSFYTVIDFQRGYCFKSFKDFISLFKHKKYSSILYFLYIISKFYEKYCYDDKLNNMDLALKNAKK